MPIMPRKATPQDPEVAKIIGQIREFCKHAETSPLALSRAAEVSQPSLFRFLNGERKTVTPTAKRVVEYINIRHNWHNQHNNDKIQHRKISDHDGYQLIQDAAMALWDGNHRSAELLASLIKALKPAVELAILAAKGDSKRG